MFRRAFAVMISGILWAAALGGRPATAQKMARLAEDARAEVQRLSARPDARIEVRLKNGTRLKGSLISATGDTFTVRESKTGAARALAYEDVARVKKTGGGLSPLKWVLIGAAAAAVVVGVTVIGPAACDGGAGC